MEQLAEHELSQHFADQLGWEDMVYQVSRIYEDFPPDDRTRRAIFCSHYGAATTVDFYVPAYGLLPAISVHNTYHRWVPRGLEGEGVTKENRDLMGATNPEEAAVGTIRKDFAGNIEQNAVHGSDAPETAAFEISYFFNALEIH